MNFQDYTQYMQAMNFSSIAMIYQEDSTLKIKLEKGWGYSNVQWVYVEPDGSLTPILEQIGPTYTLTEADSGKAISVKIMGLVCTSQGKIVTS